MWAGVKHIVALGRSGRTEGASSALTEALTEHGWAAAVTLTKCDVAATEDMRAVLAPDRRLGDGSLTSARHCRMHALSGRDAVVVVMCCSSSMLLSINFKE